METSLATDARFRRREKGAVCSKKRQLDTTATGSGKAAGCRKDVRKMQGNHLSLAVAKLAKSFGGLRLSRKSWRLSLRTPSCAQSGEFLRTASNRLPTNSTDLL